MGMSVGSDRLAERSNDEEPGREDRREPFEEPVLTKQESLTRITRDEDFGGSGASGAAFF